MKIVYIILLILAIYKFESGETSIPNYLIHKMDTSLTVLEDKANQIISTLAQQERKNQAEFTNIKNLLKSLTAKIGVVENVTSKKSPGSHFSLPPTFFDESSSEAFWNTTVKFCNESKQAILQDGSARNGKHFQYSSTDEDLNNCVYLDGLCGGVLVGKKGIISYRGEIQNFAPAQYGNRQNNRTRCIWTIRSNDHKNKFRLFLRKDNLNGFKLSVTSMQGLLAAGGNNSAANSATLVEWDENFISSLPSWDNSINNSNASSLDFTVHSKHGNDVFFITLAYNRTTSRPDFFLQFAGNGLKKPNTGFYHAHRSGEKGVFHSKVDFERKLARQHHEFATFVINPYEEKKSLSSFQLNLTRVHTQNSASHEFFTFFETSKSGVRYNVAGGQRAVNNRYYGSNRTFGSGEFIGDEDYSEAIIGIYKFFNPNENVAMQESRVHFEW